MENDPISHVVTRRLTESWEGANRQLYYYDFATDTFGEQTSRNLLVADESFGHEVERFLNRTVEQHLAGYLDSLDGGTFVADIPWKQERALILSALFQPIRAKAGRGEQEGIDELRRLVARDDSYFDQLAEAARSHSRHFGAKVASGMSLFFPADGICALPLAGGTPQDPGMIFQPTSTTTFFMSVANVIPQKAALEQARESLHNGVIMAYSVGLKSTRVVVPPTIRAGTTEATLRTLLHDLRSGATTHRDARARQNRIENMKLSASFKPEFQAMIDEIEPWLEDQAPRKWNEFVIYVTDTTPEFERGQADQKTSAQIMPKAEAVKWERKNGSTAGRRLAQKFLEHQSPNKVWIVASDASNNVNSVECVVYDLTTQTEGKA